MPVTLVVLMPCVVFSVQLCDQQGTPALQIGSGATGL
jgi:hypothetical protein